jgi:hypothetical protein
MRRLFSIVVVNIIIILLSVPPSSSQTTSPSTLPSNSPTDASSTPSTSPSTRLSTSPSGAPAADECNSTLLLLCPFGTTGLDNVFRGQGCDNIDQNCDGIYDDCIEDQTPPEISLKATPTKVFTTEEEAKAFLKANLQAVDDCSQNLTTPLINFLSIDTATAEGTFEVTVQDLRCPDNNATSTTVETFVLAMDVTPPIVDCGFSIPQDPFHVQGVYDPLSGMVPPDPGKGDLLHIDSRNFDGDLAEVNMFFTIEEVRMIG